jgi:hypothetical protein
MLPVFIHGGHGKNPVFTLKSRIIFLRALRVENFGGNVPFLFNHQPL